MLVAYVTVARRLRLRFSLFWTFPPQNSCGAKSAPFFALDPGAISSPASTRCLPVQPPAPSVGGVPVRKIVQYMESHRGLDGHAGDRAARHRNRQPRPREADRHTAARMRCRRPARSPRRRAPRRDGGVGPCPTPRPGCSSRREPYRPRPTILHFCGSRHSRRRTPRLHLRPAGAFPPVAILDVSSPKLPRRRKRRFFWRSGRRRSVYRP
jgi:hypothetical protein